MRAQIAYFEGPRSAELVAAAEHAGRDRVMPAVLADPVCAAGHVGTFVLRRPDGGELVVVIATDDEVLDRAGSIIMSTELLPDEDPALLPGADRFERFDVVHAAEHGALTHDATTTAAPR